MPVAVERADDIAAAVQIEEGCVAVVLWRRCPFRPDPVCGHRLDGDVPRNPILRGGRIHVLAPLPVVVRTLPAGQLLPQCADFRVAHVVLRCRRFATLSCRAGGADSGVAPTPLGAANVLPAGADRGGTRWRRSRICRSGRRISSRLISSWSAPGPPGAPSRRA